MIRMLGLVGLVVALAVVGLLVKKQLTTPVAPAVSVEGAGTLGAPASNPRQAQEQFKQSLDAAMQQPRPMPDEAK
ncbi:MAG: hypothetical protein JSS56_09355 [Proteobacteria bacterium]|nr:hypothetical protein [Pseudomonadota bacterium]